MSSTTEFFKAEIKNQREQCLRALLMPQENYASYLAIVYRHDALVEAEKIYFQSLKRALDGEELTDD